jgi:hypothetical protein
MSTLATRPMNLLRVDFSDLYARHLCRHSQVGINVAHLAALFGTWFGVYAIAYHLAGQLVWIPIALAASYMALVALSAPIRVCIATAAFLAAFVIAVVWVPELPLWVYVLMVPVFYKLQSYSHLVFTAATDMTEFNRRYPKGPPLFFVLLVYEVPMVLNYLVIDWKMWN